MKKTQKGFVSMIGLIIGVLIIGLGFYYSTENSKEGVKSEKNMFESVDEIKGIVDSVNSEKDRFISASIEINCESYVTNKQDSIAQKHGFKSNEQFKALKSKYDNEEIQKKISEGVKRICPNFIQFTY